MNTSFDWKESFSMPGCSAALHNRDCCGQEQGELITLLFEAWAALLCCASFKNDKRLSKERSFVLGHGSFARLNHRRPLSFVFFMLGLCLNLGSVALFRLTDTSFMLSKGKTLDQASVLATKHHGVTALSTIPESRLPSPQNSRASRHRRGFAKRHFISKPTPLRGLCFQGHFSV